MCIICGDLYHQLTYSIAYFSLNGSSQNITSTSNNFVPVPRNDTVSIQEGTFDAYWNIDSNGEVVLATPTLITFVWDSPNSPTDNYSSGEFVGGYDGTSQVQYNSRSLSIAEKIAAEAAFKQLTAFSNLSFQTDGQLIQNGESYIGNAYNLTLDTSAAPGSATSPDLILRGGMSNVYLGYGPTYDGDENRITHQSVSTEVNISNLGTVAGGVIGLQALFSHEIGHTLSLTHPGPFQLVGIYTSEPDAFGFSQVLPVFSWFYDGNGVNPNYDTSKQVMSYINTKIGNDWIEAVGYSRGDILLLQQMFGVNHNYNANDTIYSFDGVPVSSDLSRIRDVDINSWGLQDAKDAFTLWDGNGVDTIKSTFTGDVLIDLREGNYYYSHIGETYIFIADGANIENGEGNSGNDTLIGNHFNNTLKGNSGNDVLQGMGGADALNGGTGFDSASYSLATVGVVANLQNNAVNTNDAAGDTYISIENLIGSAFNDVLIGTNADNSLEGGIGADILVGQGGNDTASYDSAKSRVNVALNSATTYLDLSAQQLGNHLLAVVISDVGSDADGDMLVGIRNLNGSGFDDTLTGDSQNNILKGAAGNDWLVGLGGNNVLSGGEGFDTASYNFMNQGVSINLSMLINSNGDVKVLTSASNFDILNSIENLVGTNFNDTLIGDTKDNVIEGGKGADVVDGKGGIDTVSYEHADDSVIVSLLVSTQLPLLAGDASGDKIYNVENIRGSQFNDILTGNFDNNIIEGGAGSDIILGAGGDDTASYKHSLQAVTVDLNMFVQNSNGDADGDVLIGIDNLIGSEVSEGVLGQYAIVKPTHYNYLISATNPLNIFDDKLTGDNTDNVIDGLDGVDLIYGKEGHDTINGGNGRDVLFGGNGNDIVNGDNDNDFVYGESGNDKLFGDAGNDYLSGGDGNDWLYGGEGDDILQGGAGNDNLYGGLGSNVLEGGAGADYMEGREKRDYINSTVAFNLQNGYLSYENSTAAVTINLATGQAQGGDAQGDTWKNIDGILGSQFNDTLTGNSASNAIYGEDGNDTIYGDNSNLISITVSFKNTSNVDAIIDLVINGEQLHIDKMVKAKKSVDVTLQINPDLVGYFGVNDPGSANALSALGVLLLSTQNNNPTNLQISGIVIDGINVQTEFSEGHTEYTQTVYDAVGQPLNNGSSITTAGQFYENYLRMGGNPTGADIILGELGDDVLYGMRGNDNISGGLGKDIIDGGTGSDSIYGDEGEDVISGGLGNDFLSGGIGSDKIYAYYSSAFETVSEANNLASNLFGATEIILGDAIPKPDILLREAQTFDPVAFFGGNISADDGADEIYTSDNPYASYVILGQGGNDIIHNDVNNRTSTQIDFIYGGSSEVYGFNVALERYYGLLSRSDMSVNAVLYDGDDQIWGQNGVDIVYGGFGNDIIFGGGGDDELGGDLYVNAYAYVSPYSSSIDYFFVRFSNVTAFQGDDIIHGGDGNDHILGGMGSDALFGDNGNDRIFGGIEYVDFAYGLVYMVYTEFLQTETKILHDGDDVLFGGAGDDLLAGGLGDDAVHGGIDNDLLVGDNIGLRFAQSAILTPTTINFDYYSIDYSVASNNPHDWLIDGLDQLFGDDGDDVIFGSGNNDILVGGNGADLIAGGGFDFDNFATGGSAFFAGSPTDSLEHVVESFYVDGNDIIWGDNQADSPDNINNSDVIFAGFGHDEVYGEEGDDLIFGDNLIFGSAVSINLFLPYNNQFHYIHDGDDYLDGGKGNDEIAGQGGSDILYGREGDDRLFADGSAYQVGDPDVGNNFLDGGEGDDLLVGAEGDDYLIGGQHNDILIGLNGADTFAFSLASNFGHDVIVDFDANDSIAFTDVIGDAFDYILGIGLIDYFGDSVADATIFMDSGHGLASISFDNLDLNSLFAMIPTAVNQSIDPLWQPTVGGQTTPNLMPVNSLPSDNYNALLTTASTTLDGYSMPSLLTSTASISAHALIDQVNQNMVATTYVQQDPLEMLMSDGNVFG